MCEPTTPSNPFAICSLTQAFFVDKGLLKTTPDYLVAKSHKKSEPPALKERTQPPSYGDLAILRTSRELELTRRVLRLVDGAFVTVENTSRKAYEKLKAIQKEMKDATTGYEVFVLQNIMKKERAFQSTVELLKAIKKIDKDSIKLKKALDCLVRMKLIFSRIFDSLTIYTDFIKQVAEENDGFKAESDVTGKSYCLGFQKSNVNERMLGALEKLDNYTNISSIQQKNHTTDMFKGLIDVENLKRTRNKCSNNTLYWDNKVSTVTEKTLDTLVEGNQISFILENILRNLPQSLRPKGIEDKSNREKIRAVSNAYRVMIECIKGLDELSLKPKQFNDEVETDDESSSDEFE